ncbi:MAG: hypothetical protein K2G36_05805 [Ruminococcus sp.]|nr:hypothetical protein [Ruminococcus sp.]
MTFRDLNADINKKTGAGTLRDMNFRQSETLPEESEPIQQIQSIQPIQQIPPEQASRYQSVPVQSMPLPNVQHVRTPQNVYVLPKTENPYNKPAPPVPPRPPEPVKPDPSEFVEERTETPPPKMVRVTVPVRKKVDNTNNDFGTFGTTFDGDPDQSTVIADIPVINNVDDYKI